jgi:hypothetical protein
LHSRQNALHTAQDNIAHDAVPVSAPATLSDRSLVEANHPIENQFLEPSVFDERDARLPRPSIYQDFLSHLLLKAIAAFAG